MIEFLATLQHYLTYFLLFTVSIASSFSIPFEIGVHSAIVTSPLSKPTFQHQSQTTKCESTNHYIQSHPLLLPHSRLTETSLALAKTSNNDKKPNVIFTNPTQTKAAQMGMLDWPQQTRSGSWQETIQEDKTLIRYILDGEGTVLFKSTNGDQTRPINPGTLIEATGKCELIWQTKDGSEMIILTPSYEEGGKLAIVAFALVLFTIGLVTGVGG